MKQIKRLSLAALAAAFVLLPLLMAPGGFPSRPRFQSIGVGGPAPSTVGNATITGAVRANTVGIGTPAPAQTGDMSALVNVDGAMTHTIDNDSNGIANQARVVTNSGDASAALMTGGSGRTTALVTNGPTGGQGVVRTFTAHPLLFATSNTLAMTISGAQVADFVNTPTIAGSAIATVASVPVVTTGSFTGAVTGCTTDPAPSITYTKISESSGQGIVTLSIPSFQCTSNATGFTITGAPALLDPGAADSAHTNGRVTDNSVITVDGYVRMNASNVIVVRLRAGDALWTASNFKGIANSIQMIYDTR